MVKQDLDSKLRRQVLSYPGIAREQIEGFYKGKSEASFPPDEVLKEIRHIYITGSGDCIAAARILKPIAEKLLGGFSAKVYADTPLNVGRYMSLAATNDDPDIGRQTLLIGLSVWGFPARVVECLKRAEKLGIHTLDVTNSPDTPVGHAAEFILNVYDPVNPDTHPGCRDYFGTLVGTALTLAYMSEVKGLRPEGTVKHMADEIIRLADEYAGIVDRLDDEMFELAVSVKDKVDSFECVGDGYLHSSAFFLSAKVIETSGRYAVWSNSIDFRNTSIYYKNPERIMTVFYGEEDRADKESIAEAARMALSAGREVLFIGDGPKESFGLPSDMRYIELPKADKEFPELGTFFNHLPGDLLASHLCELWGGHYFRDGSSGSFTASEITSIWARPDMSTLKGSKIVIVEEEEA